MKMIVLLLASTLLFTYSLGENDETVYFAKHSQGVYFDNVSVLLKAMSGVHC